GRPDRAGVLIAVADLWFGTPPFGLSYQWFQCDKAGGSCAPIFGATVQAYSSTAADAKAGSVVVEVTALNDAGSVSARSEPFVFAAGFSTLALTCWDTPINTSAPTISPAGSIEAGGQLFLSSQGSWDPSVGTCPGWQFRYAWFRSSALVVDNGTANNPYNTGSGDIGGVMQDQVTYEYTGPNGYHGVSSRSNGVLVTAPPPPPNNPPYFVAPFGPVGGVTAPNGGGIYAQYNDADGDSGTVTVSVYAFGTSTLLSQKAFLNIGANTYPALYMDSPFTGHVRVHIEAVDNRGASSSNFVEFEMWATNLPAAALVSPLGTSGAPTVITSPTPVLKATARIRRRIPWGSSSRSRRRRIARTAPLWRCRRGSGRCSWRGSGTRRRGGCRRTSSPTGASTTGAPLRPTSRSPSVTRTRTGERHGRSRCGCRALGCARRGLCGSAARWR
ncbi:MAG: hypothetical protein FD127_4151, partial [Acidimicrobiaceae bacterium]